MIHALEALLPRAAAVGLLSFALIGPAAAQEADIVSSAQGGLEAAYKREYALVARQKSELERRLAEFQKRAGAEAGAARGEVDALEAELVRLHSRVEATEAAVAESQQAVEAREDDRDLLAVTFAQAADTLAERGSAALGEEGFTTLNEADKVRRLASETNAVLARLGSVREEPGDFYLEDGSRVSGTVVHVGAIASYGVSPDGAGALAPAGGGELRLWSEPAADVAEALAAGRAPEDLGIFLYESLDRQVAANADETPLEHVQSGGSIAWVILALGGLAAAMIVLRFAFLFRASNATDRVAGEVGRQVASGDVSGALDTCRRYKNATSRVISAALRNLDRDRTHLEDIISESILHEREHLNRFGALILVVAAVSPLLGLLGTVTGMISTFDVITKFGTGDPKLLSGGIATALVTTELGLIVAIPALLAGTLLGGWADRIKDDMERAALHVTNLYASRGSARTTAASDDAGAPSGAGLATQGAGA